MRLTFLHISDLHVRKDWMEKNRLLFESLCQDINQWRQSYKDGVFNAVFLTGDIAFRGKAEEYDEARKIISRICGTADCPRERLFVVPGNHDIDRDQIPEIQQDLLEAMLEEKNGLNKCLKEARNLAWLFGKFNGYREFLNPSSGAGPPCLANISNDERIWYERTFHLGGCRFRVVGLCSSLLSNQNEDTFGHMRMGEDQLRNIISPKYRDPTFLLTHHPLEWLSPDERETARNFMAQAQVIHLHGHTHEEESVKDYLLFQRQKIPEMGEYYTFGVGPLDLDASEDWKSPPTYNILQLNTETGMLSVWPRAYYGNRWASWNRFPNLDQDGSFKVKPPQEWRTATTAHVPMELTPPPIKSYLKVTLSKNAEYQVRRRSVALEKFSFLWLLLDQLPGGGWGRSLVPWMTEIWKGTPLAPDHIMEAEGGIESSVLAFDIYYHSQLCHTERWDLGKAFGRFRDYLLKHQDETTGGFGASSLRQEGISLSVRLRHTALAVYALLLMNQIEPTTFSSTITEGLMYLFGRESAEYLSDRNPGMLYMLMEFFRHHILTEECRRLNAYVPPPEVEGKIERWQEECEESMRKRFLESKYEPVPEKYGKKEVDCYPLLVPYGRFFRMETYTFLASCGFATPTIRPIVRQRLSDGMQKLVNDYVKNRKCCKKQLDSLKPKPNGVSPWLVPRELPEEKYPSPDLGCTAMLLANLCNEQVRESLWDGHPPEKIKRAIPMILEDLVDLFDRYLIEPSLFRYTHVVGLGHLLLVGPARETELRGFREWETRIEKLGEEEGISEFSIDRLIEDEIFEYHRKIPTHVFARSLGRLLLENVRPGAYPEGPYDFRDNHNEDRAEELVDETVRVYSESAFCERFAQVWGDAPNMNAADTFIRLLKERGAKRILDVGCGPGQNARLFEKAGFEVTLLDVSQPMLTLACKTLGRQLNDPRNLHADLRKLKNTALLQDGEFDGIWCSATLVHFPEPLARKVLCNLAELLAKGGILMVNCPIGNPRLKAHDGRFYAYWRDREEFVARIVKPADLEVLSTVSEYVSRNTYCEPRLTLRWDNFLCAKRIEEITVRSQELTATAYDLIVRRFVDLHVKGSNEEKAERESERERVVDQVIHLLGERTGKRRVLDAGCGPGHYAKVFADRECDVVGLDLSTKMIEYARNTYENCRFEVGDLCQLPYPDQYFDIIFCMAAFQHVEESIAHNALKGFHRVLKSGGVLMLDFQLYRDTGYEPDGRFTQGYSSPGRATRLLQGAGFEVVDREFKPLKSGENTFQREIELHFLHIYARKH